MTACPLCTVVMFLLLLWAQRPAVGGLRILRCLTPCLRHQRHSLGGKRAALHLETGFSFQIHSSWWDHLFLVQDCCDLELPGWKGIRSLSHWYRSQVLRLQTILTDWLWNLLSDFLLAVAERGFRFDISASIRPSCNWDASAWWWTCVGVLTTASVVQHSQICSWNDECSRICTGIEIPGGHVAWWIFEPFGSSCSALGWRALPSAKLSRLSPEKLRVNNQSGIQLLAEAIGGILEKPLNWRRDISFVWKGLVWHHSTKWWITWLLFEPHGGQFCGALEQRHRSWRKCRRTYFWDSRFLLLMTKRRSCLNIQVSWRTSRWSSLIRLLGSNCSPPNCRGSRQVAKTKVYDVNLSEQIWRGFWSSVRWYRTCFRRTDRGCGTRARCRVLGDHGGCRKIKTLCLSVLLNRSLRTSCRTSLTCMRRWCRTLKLAPNCLRSVAAVAFGQSNLVERMVVDLEKERVVAKENGCETNF